MEAMRMIQKGQIRHLGKDVVKQNTFIRKLIEKNIFSQQCP